MPQVNYISPNLKELKQSFAADMHYHTAYSYDCQTPLANIIKLARKLKIHVAITDHNRVGAIIEAKKYKDAPIIPSIELCSKEGKEIIPYFYDSNQLIDFYERKIQPKLKTKNPIRSSTTPLTMQDLFDDLKDEECVIHIPHPFAPPPRTSYKFFEKNSHFQKQITSIEVFNEVMTRKANLAALGLATQMGKSMVGGSDGHSLKRLGKGITITKATSIEEHLNLVKKNKTQVYGKEMQAIAKVINFANTSGRSKIKRAVRHSLFIERL